MVREGAGVVSGKWLVVREGRGVVSGKWLVMREGTDATFSPLGTRHSPLFSVTRHSSLFSPARVEGLIASD